MMAINRAGRTCSFCGLPGGPGTDLPLIGGLGAQVCVRCVEDFHQHLSEWDGGYNAPFPWDRMSDAEVLAVLPMIVTSAEQNNQFVHEWVELLRERKVSWAEIGRTLGVTRQAAWERFSKRHGTNGATA